MTAERMLCPACGVERDVANREQRESGEVITFSPCGHHYHKIRLTEIIGLMDVAKSNLQKVVQKVTSVIPTPDSPISFSSADVAAIVRDIPEIRNAVKVILTRTNPKSLPVRALSWITQQVIGGIIGTIAGLFFGAILATYLHLHL